MIIGEVKIGDGTDMTICGFFEDKFGHIYREVTHNCMDYEISRNVELEKYSPLRILSNQIKGEINNGNDR